MNNPKLTATSPCLNLCGFNDDNICTGCFRTQEEITAWADASNEERQAIINNSEQRRADQA